MCEGVHCVDLGESFQTHIHLQNLASTQPSTSPLKFARSSSAPRRRPDARCRRASEPGCPRKAAFGTPTTLRLSNAKIFNIWRNISKLAGPSRKPVELPTPWVLQNNPRVRETAEEREPRSDLELAWRAPSKLAFQWKPSKNVAQLVAERRGEQNASDIL